MLTEASAVSLQGGTRATVKAGDTCFQLWSSNDLSEAQFATLNPTVYTTCGSGLQIAKLL